MATDFLTRCFRPGETIALLLRREQPPRIAQRIVRLEQATAPAYLRWLAYENAGGMNVYVAANPLHAGSRKRTKASIAEFRHLYLDIDCDGERRLALLRASTAAPVPTAILSTSPGKYQVLWRVEGFNFELQEDTLRQLALTFGGDTACTDCNRVIRLPGFHNCKYVPEYPVTVEYLSDSVASPHDFPAANVPSADLLRLRPIKRRSSGNKHTRSEQDWAWVLSELTTGKDAPEITEELALRRADKPNPIYYAQRTVDVASAHLALLAGSSIREVIGTLEQRRKGQFPAAICSARAREIAQTATRMIAHKQSAKSVPHRRSQCHCSKSTKPARSARLFG